MKSIAFHSKIHLQTREFHIHTGSVPEKQVVISEIFEEGQFITARQLPFLFREIENKSSEIQYLKSIATDLHVAHNVAEVPNSRAGPDYDPIIDIR